MWIGQLQIHSDYEQSPEAKIDMIRLSWKWNLLKSSDRCMSFNEKFSVLIHMSQKFLLMPNWRQVIIGYGYGYG